MRPHLALYVCSGLAACVVTGVEVAPRADADAPDLRDAARSDAPPLDALTLDAPALDVSPDVRPHEDAPALDVSRDAPEDAPGPALPAFCASYPPRA